MITRFDKFSGVFGLVLNNKYMVFNLKYVEDEFPFRVYLYQGNKLYQELSVVIQDSEKLSDKEFFMNPEIENEIIDILIKENFVGKTNKNSMAGDKIVYSYILLV